MRKALFISANHWTTPFQVGTHHLAKGLIAKGWEILFISEPLSPLHYIKRNDLLIKERFSIYNDGGYRTCSNKLFHYVPFTFLPYRNIFPFNSSYIVNNWQNYTKPSLKSFIKMHGFDKVDLLYMDTIRQPFWLKEIKFNKSAFRMPDLFSGYSNFSESLADAERFILETTDIVFYTAHSLEKHLRGFSIKQKKYLPNGVDYNIFAQDNLREPEDLRNIKHPRVIYIGEMEKRFDHSLFKFATAKLPEISFVLLGERPGNCAEYSERKNVFFLGKRKYEELPNYLANCNAGIIPYDIKNKKELIDNINPLKLYQYFAAGLPVVTPTWKELEKLSPPTLVYKSETEFISKINEAIEKPLDKAVFRSYAKNYDWRKITDDFLEAVE